MTLNRHCLFVVYVNIFIIGCWEQRYGGGGYYGEGFSAYSYANTFIAHYLSLYPPDTSRSNELVRAVRPIVIALEHKTWEDGPQRLPPETHLRQNLNHMEYITRFNVSLIQSYPYRSRYLILNRLRCMVLSPCSKLLGRLYLVL